MRSQNIKINQQEILVIDMSAEPIECAECEKLGFHKHCVPWYCGPTLEGESDGRYQTVCESCHDKWVVWSDDIISKKRQNE